ncbi:kelch protein 12 [Echinococcus multilocularis]|uniref:Kelch protein 12 n=1 Tax=Echinococcus multilocularis TaxID=6211 RepID=A0A087VYI7_ECHMU|nr:kelch protein 12 [Echinococcus multilocularis]
MAETDVCNQSSRENSDAERYSLNAFAKMNMFRKRGQLCDVVVKVGGRVFPAHRVVLAASSDYFGAMFSNGMAESAQLEIELKSVSADVMEALLDFVYTGQVRVSMENVQELLPAASLVQMEGVKAVCSAFLFGQVEASNVLGIRRFAELHSCTDLEVFAKNYAAHNFETVVEFEEFLLMNADELIELLSREDLHIDSEETAYNAVIRWVYYDEPNRSVHLPNLLNYVRLAIMSVRFLTDIVDSERLIRQSLECRDLVDEAKRFHLRPDLRSQMRQRRFHQRDVGDEYLVVIGGFGSYQSPSDSVEMFNPRTREWSELPNLPISYRYVAACSLGTCVYVIGGFDGGERLNTVGLLDVAQREDGWRWLAPMHYKRGLSAACTHKGLIYVCGGFDGQTRLRALEVYHPKIDEWRVLEEMTTAREGAGLVVADDTLFCLGGYDGFQLLNSMEAFDLRRGTWSQCKPMYMRRSGAGCAVIVDTLYVCGGYGGPEGRGPLHLDTVEAYNTRLTQWTLVANMNVPRCYVGACQLAGRVYVAAGYNGNRLLNTVESFDPIDNTWTLYEESRMHNERCDTGMCVVRFLSCAEPPTGSGSSLTTSLPQPRTMSYTHRSRSAVASGNGDGSVQTQVVQIVTPLFQGHTTPSALSTPLPPPSPPQLLRPAVGISHRAHALPLQNLPESTGAPPIPGQRVMPIQDGAHAPILAGVHMSNVVRTEESFADDGSDEGADVDEDEEPSERNVALSTDLLNDGLELLADPSEITSGLPTVGIGGDGAGTSDVQLAFQHPDGASAEEGGVGLMLLQPLPSEMDGEQMGEEEVEDEFDEEAASQSPPQPLITSPPGLGLILEGMDANLQHRMAFLRGRESSDSQDSLLAEDNRSRGALDESRAPFNINGESDPRRLGRPPSPLAVPSSSTDSLFWIHRHQQRHSASSLSTSSSHAPMAACTQSGDGSVGGSVGGEDSRSDGEGEEGESETMMSRNRVATIAAGVGEPPRATVDASSPVSPSTPTPNDLFSGDDGGDGDTS